MLHFLDLRNGVVFESQIIVMEKGYKLTGYFMLLLMALVFVAFHKTYFGQFPSFDLATSSLSHSKISIFHHIHVVFALLWVLLLILQPLLIRYKKYKTHKYIGRLSYGIFPLLILSCIQPIFRILNADHAMEAYIPISDCLVLILFYVLAIYHKKDAAKHMRYMIGTAFVFLGPVFGRIGPYVFDIHPKIAIHIMFMVVYLIVGMLVYYDRKYGRNFRPYLIVLAAMLVKHILFFVLL